MFRTDDQLKEDLSGLLSKQPGALDRKWDVILPAANRAAYGAIVRALAARGYSKAVIDTWDDGAEFQRDIGLYWTLTKGGGLEGYDDRYILKLDRREELKDVPVTVAGVYTYPDKPIGTPSVGALDTSDDLFVLDPDDERRGEVTVF